MEDMWRQVFPSGVSPKRMLLSGAAMAYIDIVSPVVAALKSLLSITGISSPPDELDANLLASIYLLS
jgi:hypothetical protein